MYVCMYIYIYLSKGIYAPPNFPTFLHHRSIGPLRLRRGLFGHSGLSKRASSMTGLCPLKYGDFDRPWRSIFWACLCTCHFPLCMGLCPELSSFWGPAGPSGGPPWLPSLQMPIACGGKSGDLAWDIPTFCCSNDDFAWDIRQKWRFGV